MEKEKEPIAPRVWIYARHPGSYTATKSQAEFLALRAKLSGAMVVGVSMDARRGWRRPGYRNLIRQMQKSDFDCIYITQMATLGHSERQLLRFFSLAMKRHIKVRAVETSLPYQANTCRLGRKLERRATKRGWELPWA